VWIWLTDVGNRRFSDERIRAAYLEQLRGHLVKRAAGLLTAGERLSVSITELDMAGEFEAWRPPSGEARIVKDIYPPRTTSPSALQRTTASLSRKETRAAIPSPAQTGTRTMRCYEKVLIDRWLEQELKGR
jgi:hypothetical protein